MVGDGSLCSSSGGHGCKLNVGKVDKVGPHLGMSGEFVEHGRSRRLKLSESGQTKKTKATAER